MMGSYSGPRVLLVEDDLATAMVQSYILRSAGYSVTLAESGEQALARIELMRPDLIVLDLNLPGQDGFSVARRLAEGGLTSRIPIVVVTAHPGRVQGQFSDDLENIRSFLYKPCEERSLLGLVAEALAEISGGGQPHDPTH